MVTFPTQIEDEIKFCIEKETKITYLNRFSDKAVFPKERPLSLCIFLIKTVKYEHNLCKV
ncbi:MAG TPA: hypothetical protein DDW34_08640 [Clostridium sp.]|jgi:hypothetical protein|nr:hypothetical protein [Clostridium sp.]